MLTAAAGLRDRVDGLDLGADDYLTKPFAFAELVARVGCAGPAGTARPAAGARAGRDQARPAAVPGLAGRRAARPVAQGVRGPGGADARRGPGRHRRGTAGKSMGRERRPVHERGPGGGDDAAPQAGRPAGDRDGAWRRRTGSAADPAVPTRTARGQARLLAARSAAALAARPDRGGRRGGWSRSRRCSWPASATVDTCCSRPPTTLRRHQLPALPSPPGCCAYSVPATLASLIRRGRCSR